jgi:hypothetical protein
MERYILRELRVQSLELGEIVLTATKTETELEEF